MASSAGVSVTADMSIASIDRLSTVFVCGGIETHLFEDSGSQAGCDRSSAAEPTSVLSAPAATFWRASGFSTVIAARFTGRTCRASSRISRHRGERGHIRHRPQPLHLRGRHGSLGHDAQLHQPPSRLRARRVRFRSIGLRAHQRRRGSSENGAAPSSCGQPAQTSLHDQHHVGEYRGSAQSDRIGRRDRLSTRQLERLFLKYLHCTPSRYYLEMRLNRARALLQQTCMSVTNVALATGFVSASHFSKSYRLHFGHAPRETKRLTAMAAPPGRSTTRCRHPGPHSASSHPRRSATNSRAWRQRTLCREPASRRRVWNSLATRL